VPIDLASAQRWLEQASRKGHHDAQATLGLLLFENGNRTGGLRWLKQAAERGEPRALLVYGTALFNGDGIPADPVLAYAYVSRAAAQGLAPAKTTLAEMDQMMPVEQRQKGVAIAIDKAVTSKPTPPAKPKAMAAKPLPSAPAAKAATATTPARGNWRIQLGAFSQRSNAEALYKKLSGKAVLDGRNPIYVAAGAVTRLQVGPFESRSAAQAACNALGIACFPVPAK
jgi:TPR repeat protein